MGNDKVQLFENQPIRTAWVEDEEEWYFSVVDVVGALTEQSDYEKARKYWNKLKQRLKEEGSQLVTKCHQLKMTAQDGKKRFTDVANAEQILRLIQSVPSKKAELFKLWLAQVGRERMEEVIDPELTIERTLETYAKKTIIKIHKSVFKIFKKLIYISAKFLRSSHMCVVSTFIDHIHLLLRRCYCIIVFRGLVSRAYPVF